MNGRTRHTGYNLSLALALLLLTSCRTAPPPDPAAANGMISRYAAALPVRFDSRQALLFEFRPHWWWPSVHLPAIGYATVDRATGDYAMACLSPLGVKLFDIARSNGQVRCSVPFPAAGDRESARLAMSTDIADLLFDLVPPPDAVATRDGDRLIFCHTTGTQTVEQVFSAVTGRLLTKTRFSDGARVNTICFSGYRDDNGRTYPVQSVLHNHRLGYRLAVTIQTLTARANQP
jgi:hypothetical protein